MCEVRKSGGKYGVIPGLVFRDSREWSMRIMITGFKASQVDAVSGVRIHAQKGGNRHIRGRVRKG